MKHTLTTSILIICLLISCKNDSETKAKENKPKPIEEVGITFKNKGHQHVYDMVQKVGNYEQLRKKKDVTYTYTYQTPDGKTDVSTEKYIFNGELSYGAYKQHERTLPNLKGLIEQGYDGQEYWLKHNGELLNDDTYLKRVKFNRPTNFYWFTMFQKLLDPGLNYENLGEETINDKLYNVVKITFQSDNDKPTDIYQLYINKNTKLVDQFLFTVADFGKMEIPFLMKLQYKKVDDLLIPTTRQYKESTWKADVTDKPWIKVNWTDIKFNNNLSIQDFKKTS